MRNRLQRESLSVLYYISVLDNLFILQLHSGMPGVSSSLRLSSRAQLYNRSNHVCIILRHESYELLRGVVYVLEGNACYTPPNATRYVRSYTSADRRFRLLLDSPF